MNKEKSILPYDSVFVLIPSIVLILSWSCPDSVDTRITRSAAGRGRVRTARDFDTLTTHGGVGDCTSGL